MEDYNNAKVIIKQIDASDSNGLISIQVCGEIANNNEAPRKFIQSFLLTQYRLISDIFKYVDEIGTTRDTGSVVKEESVAEETPLVEEPVVQTPELEVPTALENVESHVSQTNSSPVGKANNNVDEPAVTVTDKKQVKKEAEEASPNAEEQKTEEAAPVVEEPPVAKKSLVVEDPPKPVVKPAASTFTEVQKSQQKVGPAKGWREVKTTPNSEGKPPVASFKEIQELQLKAAAVKNTQQKVDPYKGWGGVKKPFKPVRKPNVGNLKEIQKSEPKPVQALKEVS